MTLATMDVDLFDRWLSLRESSVGKHELLIFTERGEVCDEIIEELREIVHSHYVAPERMAKWLTKFGAPDTAELIRVHLPTSKTARSADFGEILATELAERNLAFRVPVRRLRFKDDRNMALRGDDIVAIARDIDGHLKFLKGEAKSRVELSATVVSEAAQGLDQDDGHPDRQSVLFVAGQLAESDDELACELELAVLDSFHGYHIEHLLFTVSGNSPDSCLSNHVGACTDQYRRYAVGVHIVTHGEFIEHIFREL